MNEEYKCPEHAICKERINNAYKEIDSLKTENNEIKKEVQDMKVQQIKDGERIITLYNVVGEIKDYIKTINEKLDKQNEKPDSFKDAAFRLFEKIVEYAILGGLFYWIANLSK